MNDAKSNPWAEIKRLQAENANLHFLIEQANGAMAGLRNQLAATEEALAQVQRESAELREKYHALKRVADAAWAWQQGVQSLDMLEVEIREYRAALVMPRFPPGFDVKRAEKGLAQEMAQGEPRIGQD